jgi:hypothetical protein
MGSPIQLADASPEGADQINGTRTADELAIGAGEPLTARQLIVYLHLLLPPNFPNFVLADDSGAAKLRVPRALTEDENGRVREAWEKLKLPFPYSVEVVAGLDPSSAQFRWPKDQGDLDLIPSRRLKSELGPLKALVDEDDSYWSESRIDLLTSTKLTRPIDVLPSDFVPPGTHCLVNASAFPAANIRNYLTLYDAVFLVAPLRGLLDEQCAALGITADELVKLVILGRVRLLLPQPIDRYDRGWLQEVAEAAPQNVIASRRLAAATVLDTRRRWPLFYPPMGISDRHAVLAAICAILDKMAPGPSRSLWEAILDTIRSSWTNADNMLNERGAQATAVYGVPSLVASMYEKSKGKDLRLELWAAGASVEWASALGASVFPTVTEGYDEESACEMIASILAAQTGKNVPTVDSTVFRVLDGILSIDNDIPVLAFAKEFGSGDIARLRALVLEMARWNQEPTFLQEAIEKFNADVRSVEKRPGFLRGLRLEALVPALATALLPATTPALAAIKTYGPLGVWIAGAALLSMGEPLIAGSASLSRMLDFVSGAVTMKGADAVLVARAKKQIKIIKG